MKIKKTGGRIVHSPLSFSFQMLELGGSYVQKFSALTGEYIPDRTEFPYLLKPQLVITDPDGITPTGEYTSYLKNVLWNLVLYYGNTSTRLVEGVDYTVNTSTHALSLEKNVGVEEVLHIEFTADYLDKTRGETTQFTWKHDLTTISENEYKINLVIDQPSKINLSPFKYRDVIAVNATLQNGDAAVDDAKCTYLWEVFNAADRRWEAISDDELWYVSGKNTKTLTVKQNFIQHLVVRITAYLNDDRSQQGSEAILLRRWYGQYEPEAFFSTGKYVFVDTRNIVVGAKVTNRQGLVAGATRYFDIELFYRKSASDEWKSIGYGEEVILPRDSQIVDHQVGVICRELSAYVPIELPDGSLLTDEDGEVFIGQYPTSNREVE